MSKLLATAALSHIEQGCTDVVSYVNCHNTSQLDDSIACGLLAVHTRGFVLIDHSGFALVPYGTTPPCAEEVGHDII